MNPTVKNQQTTSTVVFEISTTGDVPKSRICARGQRAEVTGSTGLQVILCKAADSTLG